MDFKQDSNKHSTRSWHSSWLSWFKISLWNNTLSKLSLMNEHSQRKLSKYIGLCARWNSSNSKNPTFQIRSMISIIFYSRIIKRIHLTAPASLEANHQLFQESIKEITIMISYSKVKIRILMKKSNPI